MRDIRFKCWDKKRKIMTPSFPIYKCTGDPEGQYIFLEWTGLKDKHRKMIFEGDVLTPHFYADYTKDNRFKCEILFKNGMFCFGINKPFIDTLDFLHASLKRGKKAGNDYIVIGNKWENPELLKQ